MLGTSVDTNKGMTVLARPDDVKQYDYSESTTNTSVYILS